MKARYSFNISEYEEREFECEIPYDEVTDILHKIFEEEGSRIIDYLEGYDLIDAFRYELIEKFRYEIEQEYEQTAYEMFQEQCEDPYAFRGISRKDFE